MMEDAIPQLTKDEYIQKARKFIGDLESKYMKCFQMPKGMSEDNLPDCQRCHGFTQIEEGGESIVCNSCGSTGLEYPDKTINVEDLDEAMHEMVFEGEGVIWELIYSEIKD